MESEQFSTALKKFSSEYADAKRQPFAKNPFGTFVRNELPQALYDTGLVKKGKYVIEASVGKGNWAEVPWIGIFSRVLSASPTKGVYIVYLLSKDTDKLYLTFNQGCTDIITNHSKKETISIIRDRARLIVERIGARGFRTDGVIDLGRSLSWRAELYQKGTIFYKEYSRDNIPAEGVLFDDLQRMLDIYEDYITAFGKVEEDWHPSVLEYNPEITKDQWLSLLNNPKILGPVWGAALAMFYTEPEGTTCAALGEKFGRNPSSISGNCTQLAKRIQKETNCPIPKSDGKNQYWPILFFGKYAGKEEPGVFAWKLRPELYEALTEFGISKYLPAEIRTGTFDSWEIIDESTAIKHCDKSFFAYNSSGVPKDICWFFDADQLGQGESVALKLFYKDKEYTGKVANETTDRKRTRLFWNSELGSLFAPMSETAGSYATFRKLDKGVYSIELTGGEIEVPEIDVKEAVLRIKPYIYARGFDYPDGLIENFYLSLKSKPFVILAGTSGTGKTRLVKLFAEAIGAEYRLVSVRPDWSDGSDLFGHTDLNGNFVPGPVCNAFDTARENPDKPVFLCLDEMNLARVEYYLSDFLSVIESRERFEGQIITDAIAQYEDGIPDNLYIIGTVNMDETTFPFSKKVLDRANTIEFSYVDLMPQPRSGEILSPQELPNSFLRTEYLVLSLDCMHEWEYMNSICAELKAINEVLAQANAHVGYRVRDEIVFYLLNNKNAGNLLTHEQAMDNEIMQKILPRIQGSSAAVKNMLCELFKICAGDYEGIQTESDNASAKMLKASNAPDCKYPKSAKKIAFMVRRYEEDGFTSYWL